MLVLRSIEKARWLAGGNLLIAAGLVTLTGLRTFPTLFAGPSANVDIDAIGYAWLAVLPCFLAVGLLTLSAAAHSGHWPFRWVFEGLAMTSLIGALVALYVFT